MKEIIPLQNIMIEHLVLSGGGTVGFIYIGILKNLITLKYLDMSKIKTIHAVSVGGIIGGLLALNHSIETIEEYVVNKPWGRVFDFNISTVIEALRIGGLFNETWLYDFFKSFILSQDLSLDITLQELYDFNPIEIHFYVTEVTEFCPVDISYKTHPNWKLLDAIYASLAIPVIFAPITVDNKIYIDGAIFMNYPLEPCIDQVDDPDTILACYLKINEYQYKETEYKILDYILLLVMKLWKHAKTPIDDKKRNTVKHQYMVTWPFSMDSIIECIKSKQERERMVLYGIGLGSYDCTFSSGSGDSSPSGGT